MKQNFKNLTLFAIALMLALSACKANISRNGDGTATVETSMSQAELQEVISSSIADPLIKSLTVTLQPGYVSVTGDRQRLNDASKIDTISFRLDLGVNNGELTASISGAQIDGLAIEQNRVDHWNQTIANRITNFGNRSGRSKLQSVSITPEQVTMTWLVTK